MMDFMEVKIAVRHSDVSKTYYNPEALHPSTDPEVIREVQRGVIRLALYAIRPRVPTDEELSDMTDLPVSIIKVRLVEIAERRARKLEMV